MDWKLFWLTFTTIFLAELGDKTQLGVLSLSATSRSPITIFLAATFALILASFIGVLLGTLLSRFIHPKTLRMIGGMLFIAIGCWILFKPE